MLIHSNRDAALANLRELRAHLCSPEVSMPDPIEFADVHWLLSHAPKQQPLTQLIERQYLANPVGVPYGARKDDRSCREMVLMSWPAQLATRLLLHEGADALVDRQHPRSFAGRMRLTNPRGSSISVLTTEPFGPAFGAWRREISQLAQTEPSAVLKTDIKRFYPSVGPYII